MNAILIVLPILTLLMFQLGLECKFTNFLTLLKHPKALIVGLIGQLILLPLIAFILAYIFQLNPIFFIGLMLIACSPGGSSSNIFSMLAKGNVELSVTLTAFSSILTLITIPIIMSCIVSYTDNIMHASLHLPIGKLLLQNLILVLIPFFVGMFYQYKFKRSTIKISNFLKRISFPALILLATIFFIQNGSIIYKQLPQLGLIISIFIILAMLCGKGLAMIAKLNRADQRTIIIEVGMQNAAQAIAIASSPFLFANDIMAVPAILYALFMNLFLLTYVRYNQKKEIMAE